MHGPVQNNNLPDGKHNIRTSASQKENSSSRPDNYRDWSIDDSTVDVDAAATSLLLVPSARFGASSVRPTSQEPFHYLSCAGTSTTVDNGDSAMMMIGRIRFKGSS